jgi:type II secretory pathway component GspD/PulD (secretin)
VQTQHTKKSLLVFLRPSVLHNVEEVTDVTNRKYEKVWEISINSEDQKTHSEPLPPLDTIYDGRKQ